MVEDNSDDVELTLRSFQKNNFTVLVDIARDGADALAQLGLSDQALAHRPSSPCLLLLDLNLPKVPGFEILKRVRANDALKLMPVVILTSSNAEKDRLHAETLGANLYICKPLDLQDFDKVVDQIKSLLPPDLS